MTPTRLRWGLLATLTALSVIIVTTAFNPVPHTGGDNAGYIALAHSLITTGSYTDAFDPEGLPHTKYPPVFPGLLAVFIGLGARTWVALKMTAVVSTVAAVAFTYLWAERSVGALTAFAVGLLLATSSGVVYYSHWVLSDPLFVAFTIAALFALAHADQEGARPAWLIVGVLAAGLAYFTRSAGLPLIVALLAWLGIRGRWRVLGITAVSLALPMLAWLWRGRGAGVAQYGTEFWMVDPYQPALGTVGLLGLIPRVFANLSSYVLQHGPAGVVGTDGPALSQLGVALAVGAIAGWVLRIREGISTAEIFFPLYIGLILLWPEVWGGDRFLLPVYPLVFLYGAVALGEVARRIPAAVASPLTAVVFLVLLLPAAGSWFESTRQASACAEVSRARGAWGCYGSQVGFFVAAATWTGPGLPDGSAVLTRKPRHFYVQSGRPSRAFAFEEDAAAHLALADAIGARYVLLDRWDGLASRYVGAAVRQRPGAFCFVRGFGQPEEGGAQLLGIFPPAERPAVGRAAGAEVQISACPAEYVAGAAASDYSASGRIPLLEKLDS